MMPSPRRCKCGCGRYTKMDASGRVRAYVKGHATNKGWDALNATRKRAQQAYHRRVVAKALKAIKAMAPRGTLTVTQAAKLVIEARNTGYWRGWNAHRMRTIRRDTSA